MAQVTMASPASLRSVSSPGIDDIEFSVVPFLSNPWPRTSRCIREKRLTPLAGLSWQHPGWGGATPQPAPGSQMQSTEHIPFRATLPGDIPGVGRWGSRAPGVLCSHLPLSACWNIEPWQDQEAQVWVRPDRVGNRVSGGKLE